MKKKQKNTKFPQVLFPLSHVVHCNRMKTSVLMAIVFQGAI